MAAIYSLVFVFSCLSVVILVVACGSTFLLELDATAELMGHDARNLHVIASDLLGARHRVYAIPSCQDPHWR